MRASPPHVALPRRGRSFRPEGFVFSETVHNPPGAVLCQQSGPAVRRADREPLTNTLPMTLAPRIVSISPTDAAGTVTFTVKCSLKVAKTQQVLLVVGERELLPVPIVLAQTDTLTFKTSGRVDGIDSQLINRSKTPPEFFPSELVSIP
jgi:hypothetical protein